MKFYPHADKVEVKPLTSKGIIQASDKFEEMGEVLQIGKEVSDMEIGDTICFLSHGCWKTPKDDDGVEHWVVTVAPQFILGVFKKE